jgi:glycerol-3-phosphate dehydrogenase (NAD(P)+)
MTECPTVAVLGAGSWGTTLALLLTKSGKRVRLWEFRPDAIERMSYDRENKEFLPGHPFPPQLEVCGDIHQAVAGAEYVLMVVPTHGMRSTAAQLKGSLLPEATVISAAKGIEEGSLMRISELLSDVWGSGFDTRRFTVLSGPSHAEEVVLGVPTTIVAGSSDIETAHRVQRLLSTERFRVYASEDVVGVELGGSLKNVVAIAAGMCDGLGFGDNVKGALLTRGLAEISRLGVKLGGKPATFAGLSGMGDLVTTCCSRHSRNRYVGEQIGQGRTLKDVLGGMVMVAEGVRTTASAWALAQREGIEMPITEQVHKVLFEDADPLKATMELMTRKLKVED